MSREEFLREFEEKIKKFPLVDAIINNDSAKFYEIIKNTPDTINEKGIWEAAPLYFAAYMSDEFTRVLLEKGAEVNAVNINGGTSLHAAVTSQNAETAELLLKFGAKQVQNKVGITPQDVAFDSSNVEIYNMLKEYESSTVALSGEDCTV